MNGRKKIWKNTKRKKERTFLALFPARLMLGCKGTSATCYVCPCNSDICVISRTFASNSTPPDQDCSCSARTIDVYYNVTLISNSFCITGVGCLSLIKTHRVYTAKCVYTFIYVHSKHNKQYVRYYHCVLCSNM
jgi:hypothetical protein